MNKTYQFIFALILCFFGRFSALAQTKIKNIKLHEIDLAGNWNFQIDSLSQGIKNKWYAGDLKDNIHLPGSMTTNLKGNDISLTTPWTGSIVDSGYFTKPQYAKYRKAGNIKVPFWLQPEKYYKGAAWYQKTVDVPASWNEQHIELYIERAHWETTVWVDEQSAGMQNSLGTAHVYDLTTVLKPGRHRITILVDNSVKSINFGENSHSISDHTQSNWNGMIGKLKLNARPADYIDDIQIYPDLAKKQIVVEVKINNDRHIAHTGDIELKVNSVNHPEIPLSTLRKKITISKNGNLIRMVYSMGISPLFWSEFQPNLYNLQVTVINGANPKDVLTKTFGMRNFETSGTNFTINGRLTMLRGSLECAAFPMTGYPPTDISSWLEEFKTCKAFGLNHLRFHSWCPPEAAFEAADRLGIYLQIECSSWANQGATIGDGLPLDDYIYKESRAIVQAYGNHPSFCMLLYGNEPAGKNLTGYLRKFVLYWKARDHRRLYTTGAGWPVIDQSDYNSTDYPRIQHWGEGLKSIVNSKNPSSDFDWSSIIAKWHHPTISHEIGQWCAYPDFDEIAKYTGVLKAKNFEIFLDQLKENNLSEYEHDFLRGSGKLQILCYKADIEAALRTKGFGGFQLLGLSDFPGQGTALVGVLNVFWKAKPYVTASEFSRFCNTVVPLVRLPKMVYTNSEELDVPVEIAQFGENVLKDIIPAWEISGDAGEVLFKGRLAKTTIPFGNGLQLGQIKQTLTSITKSSKLTLTVFVGKYKNSWDIFVYPEHLPDVNAKILITQQLDSNALKTLNNGGKVLLTLKKGSVSANKGGDIAVGFSSIFWNTAWTNSQPPATLGILCDPKHSAFNDFPTGRFSNYQWWDAMSHSSVIKLDSVAKGLHPILRVIDDWVTARSLGLIFECRIGPGKLVVSGIDLLSDAENRPEVRQLLYSLKNYMAKKDFDPQTSIEVQKIKQLSGAK
ncbi:sugar-binding domain-containing protein [Mucilaginibacter sp. UYCu711]|uniref:sugar-binding domain-containing protein n=1 Tax=Mucilaginibacter sp. UYCu711 TaxID=3156339 RepID=UPI003D1ED748